MTDSTGSAASDTGRTVEGAALSAVISPRPSLVGTPTVATRVRAATSAAFFVLGNRDCRLLASRPGRGVSAGRPRPANCCAKQARLKSLMILKWAAVRLPP